MGEPKVWKQTPSTITQVPLSTAINEVSRHVELSPELVEKELTEARKLFRIPGAKYHIWRDSLH